MPRTHMRFSVSLSTCQDYVSTRSEQLVFRPSTKMESSLLVAMASKLNQLRVFDDCTIAKISCKRDSPLMDMDDMENLHDAHLSASQQELAPPKKTSFDSRCHERPDLERPPRLFARGSLGSAAATSASSSPVAAGTSSPTAAARTAAQTIAPACDSRTRVH